MTAAMPFSQCHLRTSSSGDNPQADLVSLSLNPSLSLSERDKKASVNPVRTIRMSPGSVSTLCQSAHFVRVEREIGVLASNGDRGGRWCSARYNAISSRWALVLSVFLAMSTLASAHERKSFDRLKRRRGEGVELNQRRGGRVTLYSILFDCRVFGGFSRLSIIIRIFPFLRVMLIRIMPQPIDLGRCLSVKAKMIIITVHTIRALISYKATSPLFVDLHFMHQSRPCGNQRRAGEWETDVILVLTVMRSFTSKGR